MLNRRDFLQHASCAVLSIGTRQTAISEPVANTQVFYDPNMLRHEPSIDHPESPKRLEAVMGAVGSIAREGRVSVVTPKPATDNELLLVHAADYVKKVRAEIAAGRPTLSTGDTEISSGSLTAASAAVSEPDEISVSPVLRVGRPAAISARTFFT